MGYDKRPIGVFDSGVGGLTVASEIIKALPNEDIIYFGDTARVPYGSKSVETITKFSRQIVNFLMEHDVKAVVVACNTVSSNGYEVLKQEFDVPIIEVITPGAVSCAAVTKNKKAGIIGTEATVNSKAYENKLKSIDKEIQVYAKACPLFVPLAEEGWLNNEVTRLTADKYLEELKEKGIDTLILGCTHYPLLQQCIKESAGADITIVNPAVVAAQMLSEHLKAHDRGNCPQHTGSYRFYVSDNTRKFDDVCRIALGQTYQAEKIDIEKY